MTDKTDKLTLREINKMDKPFKNAHRTLLRLQASLGEKSLYFVIKKHYQGKEGYVPKFEI